MVVRVTVVEDDEVLQEHLVWAIRSDAALELAGVHRLAGTFQDAVARELPDVVVLDINLPDRSGVDCLRSVKAVHPGIQFLVCTVQDDDDHLFNAIRAGATGYLVKEATPEEVVVAVKDLHAGGSPMSPGIARRVMQYLHLRPPAPELATLTERERQVLHELSQGYRYKEIAERLMVSMDTVRSHVRNLYEKLHVSSRTEAMNKLDRR